MVRKEIRERYGCTENEIEEEHFDKSMLNIFDKEEQI